ncbi:hypothetical protein U8M76_13580, partial [Klebsiella pneumoniae]|uniref:alpha/beta fold hydrolase n=1 Tax=Klebsiella pneumoniae TaxID=573 RepID=UPI002AE61A14|nr:hypothetical protein [Klebsiella pneumoniae]
MNGFYSSVAGATLRWHDFPGDGLPVVFIHGLGCASSYDYPRIASDPALRERRKILGNDSNLLIVFYVQIMPDD